VKADKSGDRAKVVQGRRPSPIVVAQNLRGLVRDWREAFYAGASDTTRTLLTHWFERSHRQTTPAGEEFEFRYYFCQREAVETLIYLKEVRKLDRLSQIIEEFGGPTAEVDARGLEPREDDWTRYAFKLATGAGKTKVMSLAIVWSYFHALRESDSEMARHFVMIAPNLTVYERLKEDFADGRIFDADPLIPTEWRGDWNMSVVLQDEAGGAATGGTLYLTNIHRLYDPEKRKKKAEAETYAWAGPAVSRNKALDRGAALRERITGHRRLMVLNDEAHHVWDPGSGWNEAIRFLHDRIHERTGGGLAAQLDFSATPKGDKGQVFKHVVCDTPLGEAVDAGIVKTPVIGRASHKLQAAASDDAAFKYDIHLRLGYERWRKSCVEWRGSGKKPLLFVMCDSTEAANQITDRLNRDETFRDLNGRTINLHTNLKGKLKKVGAGANARVEFVESDKDISDEDLKALRQLSRDLDSNTSPYFCIVSVLMLREGWDVRNVTTIVPLRPYSSKAAILPEQTLGRGLRRMTPPGQASELLTVVEHPAFASLYQDQLAQEGLPIEVVEIDRVPSTTISIFPDEANKNVTALEIAIPALSAGHRTVPMLQSLSVNDVRKQFKKFKPLPLAGPVKTEIEYEGRHLFTDEVIERMKIDLPLLQSGVGAVSYFVKQIETICKIRGLHSTLAPLMQTFLEEILFEKKTDLFDPRLVGRLGDSDVGEYVRAVFVPLVRARTTTHEERAAAAEPMLMSRWKPYQVTHNERRPALTAGRTLFNLVPCNRNLEVAMAQFANNADDVASFAKNSGPQSLRIDYLQAGGRLAFYTPDFFIRTKTDNHFLVETKGREDRDVPRKARAAVAWCKAASSAESVWDYLYVPQGVFERLSGHSVAELARMCTPALVSLLEEEEFKQAYPLFASVTPVDERPPEVTRVVEEADLASLPPRYRAAAEQAVELLQFLQGKEAVRYSPVFTPLLGSIDEACRGLLKRRLLAEVPQAPEEQKRWFQPDFGPMKPGTVRDLESLAHNLKKTVVENAGLSPVGTLRHTLDYACNMPHNLSGVFAAVRGRFGADRELFDAVQKVNSFRNTYIAHQVKELTDADLAEENLKVWVKTLKRLGEA
jgi:type III restriction enzyme